MRPLAVTGYGCVTPLGRGARALFEGWRDGVRAIRPVRRFDCSSLLARFGGEIPDDGPSPRGPRFLRAALDDALAASGLRRGSSVSVFVATTKGFLESGEQVAARHPAADVGLPARFVADELRTRHGLVPRRVLTVSTACASGVAAVAMAPVEAEGDDPPDAVVCVGVDLLSDFVFRGFAALAAMDPAPCRPFDVDRAGLSASEAAAALVLESEESARERGARVRGRVLGAGLANDATHPTAPDPRGEGMAHAVAQALRSAGVAPSELGHVHAHGTATRFNDAMELNAFDAALGDAARRTPITTVKGSIGHTFGPSGLVELIASFEAVRAGLLPGVTGLARPEPGYDVAGSPRPLTSPVFLKTSAGFGGFDAAVVAEGSAP